jgi:hypothetical protein
MLKSLTERLSEAANDGEILTVIYTGGSSPGSKRRILPIRVAGHLVYARGSSSLAVKSYRIDGLSIVDNDFSAPWIDETVQTRQRALIIENPVAYFSSWAYEVHKSLWPALGVALREYVDKEKSAALRADAKRLVGSGNVKRQVTVKYLAYAMSSPPVFDFQEGDIFFAAQNKLIALQVVARRKQLEVHQIDLTQQLDDAQQNPCRFAYQLIDIELSEWLRTGVTPIHARIDAAQSYSEVLRFSITSLQTNNGSMS